MKSLAAMVACALALAACSSSVSHSVTTPSPSVAQSSPVPTIAPASTTPKPAPSTSDAEQLREWGSLVAGIESPLVAAYRKYAVGCPSFQFGTPSAPLECTLGPLQFDFTTEAFLNQFDEGAVRIGTPAELTRLVRSTRSDVHKAEIAEQHIASACKSPSSSRCLVTVVSFSTAAQTVIGDLQAWRPYTH